MRCALVLLAMVLPADALAQGWIEPGRGIAPRDWGVVKVRTNVHVRVVDRTAEVEVEEWFENRGGPMGEGDYLYPLPGEAVFGDFSLWQGEEELRGETMDAARARSIYEEIVRSQRDPALIELVGHGLLRARVFPFAAGETRKITMRYTQMLDRAGDALLFRYAGGRRTPAAGRELPMRPIPSPLVEPDRPAQSPAPPRARVSTVPLQFELVAENGAAYGEPFSPTHDVRVRRDGGRLVVRTADDMSGDFSLFLPLARGLVGMTVATHRPSTTEDGYFMLTLSPRQASGAALPRDVTAVIDVSGSMAGAKLRQTQDALRQLLSSLGERDRFRLIAFSGGVRTFAGGWTQVSSDALRDAGRWIDALSAQGGTNISGALREAFAAEAGEGRLPIVLFMTDGLPTVEERDPERIAARAEQERGEARVFAFGIGHDVNTYLLDRLSAAGRGATDYVEPGEDVEAAVGRLAAKVSHPVLTDLELAGAPVELREIHPTSLPDLFAGEELIVFGRYRAGRDDREGAVSVRGSRAGSVDAYSAEAVFPTHSDANAFIPRLWASRKIAALMREIRLNGADPELVEEVRRIALRYGILSDYTSHLVQEPGVLAQNGVDVRRFRDEAPPAPPAQMSGAGAVAQSQRLEARATVTTSSALDAAESIAIEALTEETLTTYGGPQTRMVGGRLFVRADGVWRDGRARSDTRTLRVQMFSDAYFELLRLLPELRPILAELGAATVGGERVNLAFGEEGGARLSGDRAALVRDFRGR